MKKNNAAINPSPWPVSARQLCGPARPVLFFTLSGPARPVQARLGPARGPPGPCRALVSSTQYALYDYAIHDVTT